MSSNADPAAILASVRAVPIDPVSVFREYFGSVFEAELDRPTLYRIIQGPAGADVYIRRMEPPVRKRYLIAHAAGTALAPGLASGDFDGADGVDSFANVFARELLMPEGAVRALASESIYAIANYFGVPVTVARLRLNDLGGVG